MNKYSDISLRRSDSSVLLRAGLNLIQQALSIFGDDMKLVFANQRFRDMFELPSHLCEPGADFADTIRHLASIGDYGPLDDLEAFVADRVKQARAFEPHYVERQRASGRWISVEGGPLRQGGWVAVYTDITEIKRQEEMLRSRSDELSDRLLDRQEELARTNRALQSTIRRLHETQQHLEAAEARVRLAAETTPAHIARLDAQERYTYSNQRLPLQAANGASSIIGHAARDVLGGEIYAEIAPALRSALAGTAAVVEFDVPNEDRRIRVAFTPDTSAGQATNGAYVLSMDVTTPQDGLHKTTAKTARFAGWIARFNRFELQAADREDTSRPLTRAEVALLRFFTAAPGRLHTRRQIMAAEGLGIETERALDIRISRLRQKLGDDAKSPELIRTIYGEGYIFTPEVELSA